MESRQTGLEEINKKRGNDEKENRFLSKFVADLFTLPCEYGNSKTVKKVET